MPIQIFKRQTIAGYTQLEYITVSSNQYLATGYNGKQVNGYEYKLQYNNNTPQWASHMGFWGTDNTFEIKKYSTNNNQYMIRYNGGSISGTYVNGPNALDNPIEVSFKSGKVIMNDTQIVTYTPTTQGWNNNKELDLFRGNDNYFAGNVYYFKIYGTDQTTLVRDYIPVKDSNGKAGLLDMITKQFFTSTAGGDFAAGPEIGPIIINVVNEYAPYGISKVTYGNNIIRDKKYWWWPISYANLQEGDICVIKENSYSTKKLYTYNTSFANSPVFNFSLIEQTPVKNVKDHLIKIEKISSTQHKLLNIKNNKYLSAVPININHTIVEAQNASDNIGTWDAYANTWSFGGDGLRIGINNQSNPTEWSNTYQTASAIYRRVELPKQPFTFTLELLTDNGLYIDVTVDGTTYTADTTRRTYTVTSQGTSPITIHIGKASSATYTAKINGVSIGSVPSGDYYLEMPHAVTQLKLDRVNITTGR